MVEPGRVPRFYDREARLEWMDEEEIEAGFTRFAAVFHGGTDEDFALAFTADGASSSVIEATSSRGAEGHFNPHVAAHSTRPEWLLVTSLGFASVVAQRLGE